jgi:RNA polymerase sigma factor (sigma-70 family)
MPKSDTELWREILKGNDQSWEELVKRYQALVYTVSLRAGLSSNDTADCFQKTWVSLYRNRKKLRDPTRISAWLVTTAKREALYLRNLADKQRRETDKSTQISWDKKQKLEAVSPDPLPDQEIEQLERWAQLEIAMKELDFRCQELLEILFFASEDKSYKQIAISLGISSNSLGPLRRRCLNKLKQIFKKNWGIEARYDD